MRYLLHFLCTERLSGLGAEAMLHLDEIFCAEIYARSGIVEGRYQRGKEVLKPWVSNGVSFGTFLSLMKEKYEHSRINPSVICYRKCHLPLHKGGFGAVLLFHTCDKTSPIAPSMVKLAPTSRAVAPLLMTTTCLPRK